MNNDNYSREELIIELAQLKKRNQELELLLKEKEPFYANCVTIDGERKRLENILDIIPSAAILIEAAGNKFAYVNNYAKELYGVDYTGINLESFIAKGSVLKSDGSPYSLETMPPNYSLKYGKVIRNEEITIENVNGMGIHLLVSCSPLYNTAGNITHTIVIFEDITKQKLQEEEMRRLLTEVDAQRGQLQAIIDSLPVGLWIADAKGKMILVNENAHQIWGGKAPLANSVHEYGIYNARWAHTGEKIIPEDMPMAHALRGETLKEVSIHFERFDGTFGTQFVSAAPIKDSKGNILGCVGIAQDITEHRLIEEALNASEARFRTVLKGSPVVVFSQDLELRYTWAYNPSAGFTVEAVLGKRDDEIYSSDDAAIFMAIKKDVIATGVGRRDEVITHRSPSAGGDIIHDMITEPLRDKNGVIVGVICSAIDITERKLNEDALRQSAEQFRALVTASSDVVYRMSPDWKEMHQLHRKDFMPEMDDQNCTWVDKYVHPDDRPQVLKAVDEAIRAKSIFELEHRVLRKDGTMGWTFMKAVPILDENCDIVEWFGTASDISADKQAKELYLTNKALEKSIEMKDEFLSLISHEFKTPLTVTNSALQLIDMICKEDMTEKLCGFLGTIKLNTNRQIRLVNNLLDITRINSGHLKLNKSCFDIVYVSKVIVNSVNAYAKQKDIMLSFISNISKIEVYLDEEKFERIMLNLLANALKFTPKGKSICVALSIEKKGFISISIEDEGIGIPIDKQKVIFERFGQADTSLSRQAEGSGLGLHLVDLFVNSLGGEISLESEVGKGSTFTILLPIIKPDFTNEVAACIEDNYRLISVDDRIVQSISIEFSDIYFD